MNTKKAVAMKAKMADDCGKVKIPCSLSARFGTLDAKPGERLSLGFVQVPTALHIYISVVESASADDHIIVVAATTYTFAAAPVVKFCTMQNGAVP